MGDELDRIGALLNEVFAHDPPWDRRQLEWLYLGSPEGPIVHAGPDDGAVRSGNYSLLPQTYAHGPLRVRLGLGIDLAVAPTARGSGTFRAVVEEAYERGTAAGLDGILGVANAQSAPRMVERLGWRALPDLPALAVPVVPGRRGEHRTVDDAWLRGDALDELLAYAPREGRRGYAHVRTPEWLRWRLAAPRAEYRVHVDDDVVAVTTASRARGLPVFVVLALLPRRPSPPGQRFSAWNVLRGAARHHRTPLAIYFGRNEHVRVHGIPLPRRLLPSPLSLVLHSFDPTRFDRDRFTLATFEFLDFDAY